MRYQFLPGGLLRKKTGKIWMKVVSERGHLVLFPDPVEMALFELIAMHAEPGMYQAHRVSYWAFRAKTSLILGNTPETSSRCAEELLFRGTCTSSGVP